MKLINIKKLNGFTMGKEYNFVISEEADNMEKHPAIK